MGFGWSSAVAQSTTLSVLAAAGVSQEQVLSIDHPLPDDQTELCLVATDDTVFVHRDRKGGQCILDKFDAAMAAASIPRKVSKDISLSETITALGCEITSRPHMAEPVVAKLIHLCGQPTRRFRQGRSLSCSTQ